MLRTINKNVMLFFITLFLMCFIPHLNNITTIRNNTVTASSVNGEEFNGIDTFASDSVGSNPWSLNSAGTGSIVATRIGHSKVYELDGGTRRKYITNDMTSDWTIEFYIMLANLGSGTGASVITIVGDTSQWIRFGYYQCDGFWGKDWSGSGGKTNIQSAENWSSNSWMHWRITWDALGKNFAFYVNDTLLTTHHYTVLGSLAWIDMDGYSWGNPGKIWFDSFSWSWHPNYYPRMIFDILSDDTDEDGMPDDWETANSLDPEDDTDALIDSDIDGLLNLYEYGNQTDPQDPDSDNDLLNDGPEVKTYFTDPNDADSDNDGLNDGAEINTHGTDPNDADSDNDALPDGAEINTYSTDPNDADSDNDLLNDYVEALTYSTDPNDPDSDDDGFNDKAEIDFGTNPNDALSYPGYIDPQRFTVFLILLIVAGFIGTCGVFIGKKQHKQRFIS